MIEIILPHLADSLKVLSRDELKHLPALRQLLSRGRALPAEPASIEAVLCAQYGIARQTDWPVAPLTYEFDGGRAGSDYWLRADPVYMRIARDKLVLEHCPALQQEEAQQLCDALASHFGDSFEPLPMHPERWYLRIAAAPDITTTPLSQAMGQHIDPLLPQGRHALDWRKTLNEIQMLLFDHPVNRNRESRGLPPANSVWLWGGGTFPPPCSGSRSEFYGQDFNTRAIAKFGHASVHALPAEWHAMMAKDALCLIDQPGKDWLCGDHTGWFEAMTRLDAEWFFPLMHARQSIRLTDPANGLYLRWTPSDRWKFWRKPIFAEKAVQDFAMPPPTNGAGGMDEFGNRY